VATLQLLILLLVANATPLIAKRFLGDRWSHPVDGGLRWVDGRPLFGSSKTIRGVVLSVLATSACAPLVGLPWPLGLTVGGVAMAGDLCASFVKRRLGLRAGSRATGLDQVPESLFPLLACAHALSLTVTDVVAIVAIFFGGEIVLSRLFYRFGLRDRPY
jgi:CDP-2,3-bis-(O-geranylgeranyl)-sn-glycerol synthase